MCLDSCICYTRIILFVWPTDEPGTYVHGSVIDGKFAGRIHTRKSVYFVERADVYFQNPKFHSVIYNENDVIDDPHKYV